MLPYTHGLAWLAAALAVSTACRSHDDWRGAIDPWEYPDPIPDLELVDHTGKRFHLARLSDGYVLLGFMFTRCSVPDACPLTTENMRRVQTRWHQLEASGETRGRDLHLLSSTLDPEYDTPERLAAFARDRGLALDDWTLCTGPAELMQRGLPSLFNVLALPDEDSVIRHNVVLAVLAPDRTIVKEWRDNAFATDDVIRAILDHSPRELRSSSSPPE